MGNATVQRTNLEVATMQNENLLRAVATGCSSPAARRRRDRAVASSTSYSEGIFPGTLVDRISRAYRRRSSVAEPSSSSASLLRLPSPWTARHELLVRPTIPAMARGGVRQSLRGRPSPPPSWVRIHQGGRMGITTPTGKPAANLSRLRKGACLVATALCWVLRELTSRRP